MSVDIILGLGNDQLSNQFMLVFPNGIPGGGAGERLALRMDQSFDPPEETVGEYELFYKGLKIMKTNMLDETDKHVTFDVRVDQQWGVHDDIMAWKDLVHNPRNGTAIDQATVSTTILVQALDGSGSVQKTIRFGGVVIKGVKIATFEHGSSDPSRLTLNFIFNTMQYE